MGTDGWPFASSDPFPGADADPNYDSKHVKDLYLRADPNFSGRFTVPVLWDKKQHTIVNNESSEIIRIFNSEFNGILPEDKAKLDLYPEELRKEIDEVNEWVYDKINSALHSHCALCVRDRETDLLQMACIRPALQRPPRHIVLRSFLSLRLLTKSRIY